MGSTLTSGDSQQVLVQLEVISRRESWVTDLTIWLLLKFWQITHSRMFTLN
jgi:hypothetical protein